MPPSLLVNFNTASIPAVGLLLYHMTTDLHGCLDNGIGNLGIQPIELLVDVSTGPLEVTKSMDDRKLKRKKQEKCHSLTLQL